MNDGRCWCRVNGDSESDLHDRPDELRAAINHTAAVTGFDARLIEKDYFCSIMLRSLAPLFHEGLVFKGGTALSKIHASFFRLSEDLDFVISISADAKRSDRRRAIEPVRKHLALFQSEMTFFRETAALDGRDSCRQYVAEFCYQSCLSSDLESIKLEVGLREPLVDLPVSAAAKTILMNPITSLEFLEPVAVVVASRRESYAEKVRAALTRREPAIRDYFDLHHAAKAGLIEFASEEFLELVRQKLNIRGNPPPDTSPARILALQAQVETELRVVLREADYLEFKLDPVVEFLRSLGI